MASGVRLRLDRAGVGKLLKSFGPMTNAASEQIAQNVRSAIDDDEIDVVVAPYTSDRSAALVIIADPRGVELQVSDGALTRAAAAVGLEVTS